MTSTVHRVFTVLTILSSIAVRISPLPDFYRVHKRRATGDVRVLPVVLLFVLCYTLVAYAYLVDNIFPLFAVAIFGLFTCSGFIVVFYKWSNDRTYLHKLFAASAVVLALFTVYVVLAMTYVTHESDHEIENIVGIVTIVCGIAMFASPLAAIKNVLRTKSAASLPTTMCIVNLVNCCLWIGYTMVAYDFFVFLPNCLGALLSGVQVALCVIYRPSRAKHALPVVMTATGEEVYAASGDARDRQLSVSLVRIQPLQQHSQHYDLQDEDSSHFVALTSPSPAKVA
uniref:Sugar transporter SWEET1 n=1 Tax=Globisporangium ultimum (strain ATCC 200006 / CBS 805.95 / DAOM BR144) TaxID=431595 RepID=K3WP44_GLOUD